jgi:hypothetical protein
MGFNFARSELHGHWQFFTNWNVGLIAGYYTLSTAASGHYLLLLASHDPAAAKGATAREGWLQQQALDTPRLRGAGTFLSVYFCVASATALFVTIVNFVLLDPTPRFFNMTAHLFTSLSFLVEVSLNSIELRRNELVLNMSWVMLWLVFIWPVVWLGVKPEWPYDFLDSSTPAIFVWFQLLFLVYALVFFSWCSLVTHKLSRFSHPKSPSLASGCEAEEFSSSCERLIRSSEI